MKQIKTILKLTAFVCFAGQVLAQGLPDTEWQPVEVDYGLTEAPSEAFIRFERDGRFIGYSGCNTMRGSFVTNGDAILMSPAAMTMMACPDNVGQQEFVFTRALSRARFYSLEGSDLTLTDGGGILVMRLAQRDAN